MTLSTLNRKLSVWQKRLGLHAWDLSVRYADQDEIREIYRKWRQPDTGSFFYGLCDYDHDLRSAIIYIARPEDIMARREKPRIELVLLHELAHIVFDPHEKRRHYGAKYEAFLDASASFWLKYYAKITT